MRFSWMIPTLLTFALACVNHDNHIIFRTCLHCCTQLLPPWHTDRDLNPYHNLCSVECQATYFSDFIAINLSEKGNIARANSLANELSSVYENIRVGLFESQKIIQQQRYGVAGFPPLLPPIHPGWTYLHHLSEEQLFAMLIDLFLERLRDEKKVIVWEGHIKQPTDFITKTVGDFSRAYSFSMFFTKVRESGVLPDEWTQKGSVDLLLRAFDSMGGGHIRSIESGLDDHATLQRYYGMYAMDGFNSVYRRVFK